MESVLTSVLVHTAARALGQTLDASPVMTQHHMPVSSCFVFTRALRAQSATAHVHAVNAVDALDPWQRWVEPMEKACGSIGKPIQARQRRQGPHALRLCRRHELALMCHAGMWLLVAEGSVSAGRAQGLLHCVVGTNVLLSTTISIHRCRPACPGARRWRRGSRCSAV